MSSSEHTDDRRADILRAAGLDRAAIADWPVEQRQSLVTALSTWALKEYVRLREDGSDFELVDPRITTATEAAVGATSMLSAVNLETFELAMWQGLGSI
jgi:hypothetical protein